MTSPAKSAGARRAVQSGRREKGSSFESSLRPVKDGGAHFFLDHHKHEGWRSPFFSGSCVFLNIHIHVCWVIQGPQGKDLERPDPKAIRLQQRNGAPFHPFPAPPPRAASPVAGGVRQWRKNGTKSSLQETKNSSALSTHALIGPRLDSGAWGRGSIDKAFL